MRNNIKLDGNNNIVIQSVNAKDIIFNNNSDEIKIFIKEYFDKQNELIKLLFEYIKNDETKSINISIHEFSITMLEQKLLKKFDQSNPDRMNIFGRQLSETTEAKEVKFDYNVFKKNDYWDKINQLLSDFYNKQEFLSNQIDIFN